MYTYEQSCAILKYNQARQKKVLQPLQSLTAIIQLRLNSIVKYKTQ